MASKKKATGKKKSAATKKVPLRDLPKKREDLTDDEAKNVKGGTPSFIHRGGGPVYYPGH